MDESSTSEQPQHHRVLTTRKLLQNMAQAILARDEKRLIALVTDCRVAMKLQKQRPQHLDDQAPALVEDETRDSQLRRPYFVDRVVDGCSRQTLMHLAVLSRSKSIISCCIAFGSETHRYEDAKGETPLTLAMSRFPCAVFALFDYGKNVRVDYRLSDQKALFERLRARQAAGLPDMDEDGEEEGQGAENREAAAAAMTPTRSLLHCAVTADSLTPMWEGRLDFIKRLVKHYRVSPDQQNEYGFTPAMWASQNADFLGFGEVHNICALLQSFTKNRGKHQKWAEKGQRSGASRQPSPAAAIPYPLPKSPAVRPGLPPLPSPSSQLRRRVDRPSRARSTSHRASTEMVEAPAPVGLLGSSAQRTVSPSPQGIHGESDPSTHMRSGESVALSHRTNLEEEAAATSERLSRSPSCLPPIATAMTTPNVILRMPLFLTRVDALRYHLQGPLTRITCLVLLLLLHCFVYMTDPTASTVQEFRLAIWCRGLNLVGMAWNGSAFFMGLVHTLCLLGGAVVGLVLLIYVVGYLVGMKLLQLPCAGAQSSTERAFLRVQFGLYYERFYKAAVFRSLPCMALVGTVVGLYLGAVVYNACIAAFWPGQASWAQMPPYLRGVPYDTAERFFWAVALCLNWYLLIFSADVMYQQGASSAFLPHYRFDRLSCIVDHAMYRWATRRLHRRRPTADTAEPQRTAALPPPSKIRCPSIEKTRVFLFWLACIIGWVVIASVFIILSAAEASTTRHYMAEAIAAAGNADSDTRRILLPSLSSTVLVWTRACLSILFASLSLTLLVIISLQDWGWPTLLSHPSIAVPGFSFTAHTSSIQMALIWVLGTMDGRTMVECLRLLWMAFYVENTAILGPTTAITAVEMPVVIQVLASWCSAPGIIALLLWIAAVLTTSLRWGSCAEDRPVDTVLYVSQLQSLAECRGLLWACWSSWASGVHLTAIPVPSVFGLLAHFCPQLPHWSAFRESATADTQGDAVANTSAFWCSGGAESVAAQALMKLIYECQLPLAPMYDKHWGATAEVVKGNHSVSDVSSSTLSSARSDESEYPLSPSQQCSRPVSPALQYDRRSHSRSAGRLHSSDGENVDTTAGLLRDLVINLSDIRSNLHEIRTIARRRRYHVIEKQLEARLSLLAYTNGYSMRHRRDKGGEKLRL